MRRFWEKYITGSQMEGQTRIQMTLSQGRCYINLTFILNYPHLLHASYHPETPLAELANFLHD